MRLTSYLTSIKATTEKPIKILMVTHDDLDGIGCGFVLKQYLKSIGLTDEIAYVKIISISNKKFQEELRYVLNHYTTDPLSEYHFDVLIISDLFPAISELHTLSKLTSINKELGDSLKVYMFDHHESAKDNAAWAEKYCPNIYIRLDTTKSATAIIAEDLDITMNSVTEYVKLVNAWDMWEWPNMPAVMQGMTTDLAFLADHIDHQTLINQMLSIDPEHLLSVDGPYGQIILFWECQKQQEINKCLKNGHPVSIYVNDKSGSVEYNGLLVNYPKFTNCGEFAECIFNNPDANFYDLIIFMDLGTLSFRSRRKDRLIGNRPMFDCAKYAKALGGGGHINAAGCPIDLVRYYPNTSSSGQLMITIDK